MKIMFDIFIDWIARLKFVYMDKYYTRKYAKR